MKRTIKKLMVYFLCITFIFSISITSGYGVSQSDIGKLLKQLADPDKDSIRENAASTLELYILGSAPWKFDPDSDEYDPKSYEPDIDGLKDILESLTSDTYQKEKEKFEEQYGNFNHALDSLDVFKKMDPADAYGLIDAVYTADINDIDDILDKYDVGESTESPGSSAKADTLDTKISGNTATTTITSAVISEKIDTAKEEIKIQIQDNKAAKQVVALNQEVLEKISQTKKPVILSVKAIEMNISSEILAAQENEELEIIMEEVDENTFQEESKNTPQKTYLKFAGKIYNFEMNVTTNGKKQKYIFKDRGKIKIKIDISHLKELMDLDKLGVYYYDETKKEWQYVGGKINGNDIEFETDHFSQYAVAQYTRTFIDITGHWSQKDVEVMMSKYIVDGVDADRFMPDAKVTRAQFVTMLARVLSLKYVGSEEAFEDVPSNQWYYSSVMAAYKAGIVNGLSENQFAPNEQITRQQMAAMIDRVLDMKNNTSMDQEEINRILNNYSDQNKIALWAKNSVASVISQGLMTGRNENGFDPEGKATRAEAAVVMRRLMNKI